MCHLLGVDWVMIMIFTMGGVPTNTHTVVVYNSSELLKCEKAENQYDGCECMLLAIQVTHTSIALSPGSRSFSKAGHRGRG